MSKAEEDSKPTTVVAGTFRNVAAPKYLRLSQAMHPDQIVLKIRLAQRDSAINCLSCQSLSFEEFPSYSRHLEELIYSRPWQKLEFFSCQGVQMLLEEEVEDDANTSQGGTMIQESIGDDATEENILAAACALEVSDATSKTSVHHLKLIIDENCNLGDRFFSKLWKCWDVTECDLSLSFSLKRIRDFADRTIRSSLKELRLMSCNWKVYYIDDDNGLHRYGYADWANGIWDMFCESMVNRHPLLERIEFIGCQMPDRYFAHFVKFALARHSKLQQFHVAVDGGCGEQTLSALSRAMQTTTGTTSLSNRLTRLSIQTEELTEKGVSGLEQFCRALCHARNLRYLKLSRYMIYETEMRALVDSCTKLRNLEEMELPYCGVTKQGIECFCRNALEQNTIPSLRSLTVPEDFKVPMATALVSNTSLEILSMPGRTPLHEFYLNLNRSGRRLLLQDIPNSLWPLLLAGASRPNNIIGGNTKNSDVLYFFLRNKILLHLDNV